MAKRKVDPEPEPEESEPSRFDDELEGKFEDAGVDNYLRQCVRIEPLEISKHLANVPGELAYWNKRFSDANERYLHAYADLKIMKAQLYTKVRRAIQEAGGRPTEEMVKATIEANDDVIEATLEVARTESHKNLMYGYLDSIRAKKEMVISIGAHMRAEMGADPVLRDQARGYRERDREGEDGDG